MSKILRAYTAICACGNARMTLTPDGRTNCINRTCVSCGQLLVLWRDPDADRPLITSPASNSALPDSAVSPSLLPDLA